MADRLGDRMTGWRSDWWTEWETGWLLDWLTELGADVLVGHLPRWVTEVPMAGRPIIY